MHPIDLTEAVTAAARRARQEVVDRYAKLYPDAEVLYTFDELHITEQNDYREQVLPLIWAAHRDVARQAWQQGHETPRDHAVDLTLGGEDAHVIVGPPQPNPYDPENTPSEAAPHEG